MEDNRELVGARWSDAVLCPRRACYQHQAIVSTNDIDEDLARLFWRGKVLGHAYQEEVCQDDKWKMEVEAPWPPDNPIAVGHADLVNDWESLVREVKVTTGDGPSEFARLQVSGYATFLGMERADIAVIDPRSGKIRIYPINVSEYRNRVRDIMGLVARYASNGDALPERVCSTPGVWQATGCQWRQHCFKDWLQPDDDSSVEALLEPVAGEVAQNLRDIESLNRESRGIRAHLKEVEGTRARIRDEMRPLLPSEQWVGFDDREVRISTVRRKGAIYVEDLTENGWSIPEHWLTLVRPGTTYERWNFRGRR